MVRKDPRGPCLHCDIQPLLQAAVQRDGWAQATTDLLTSVAEVICSQDDEPAILLGAASLKLHQLVDDTLASPEFQAKKRGRMN